MAAADLPSTVVPMVRHTGGGGTNDDAGSAGELPTIIPGDADLSRFTAATRTREAVRARSREHRLRQQVHELATLGGACRSLAEAGRPLTVTTVGGRSHHGRVRALGQDFVSLVVGGTREVIIPLDMVAVLEPGGDGGPAGGPFRPGPTMAEAVALLAADRPVVSIWCQGGGAPVVGELLAASAELATIGPQRGENRRAAYVRLSAVVELSVSASG